MVSPQVEEAIRLADRGDKSGAQRVLAQHLQTNPKDDYAWQWLAYVLPDRAQQIQALQQCLKFIPTSQSARDDLDSLRLGAPLPRPISPPPFPATGSQSFLERDLFLPDSDKEASLQSFGRSGSTDENFFSDSASQTAITPAIRNAPSLKQPQPLSAEPESVAKPASAKPPVSPPRQATARSIAKKGPRKKKTGFKGWQIGCLGMLALFMLVILIVGAWFGVSALTGRNPLSIALITGADTPAAEVNPYPASDATAAVQPYPENGAPAAIQPGATATAAPLPTSSPTPAPSPTATDAPLPEVSLPAPLYFLSDRSGISQIWRLSADGQSLVPITSEKYPVADFDVSPVEGQLAYTTNNQLILANADGSKRRTLVYGLPLPAPEDPTYWKTLIANPIWSPDGTHLAYAQDGVQVIDPATTITKRIEPNIFIPTSPEKTRLYFPLSWSSEGERIVVFVQRNTCSTLGIVFLSGFSRIDNIPTPLGQPTWALDGLSLYISSSFSDCVCSSGSGLWKADASTGELTTIISGNVASNGPAGFVGWPKPMADGTLLYFYGEETGPTCTAAWPSTTPLTMVVSSSDRNTNRISLRDDAYIIGESLWAPDGSLAVIRDLTSNGPAEFSPLVVLNGNGSPAIILSVTGRSLHWGSNSP